MNIRISKVFFLIAVLCFAGATLRGAMPIARSVCLLQSPEGNGSGFFASFAGRDVVITNNHVLLEMPDVKILDINGNCYEYHTVWTSAERDLAIVPVIRSNQNTMPNLAIHISPDMLEPGSKVEAYGDSLGDGVVTQAKGKFLGIGPAVIEVDAGFVQGNSGGPVVDQKSGAVIGVATYMHIIRSDQEGLRGSRFEPTRYKPSVRRFATRIDNIAPERFEKITKAQIQEDQAVFGNILKAEQTVREILNLSAKNTLKMLWLYFDKTAPLTVPEKFHSSYLKKEAEKKAGWVNRLRHLVTGDAAAYQSEQSEALRKLWLKHLDQTVVKVKPQFARKCPKCNGTGKVREPLSGAKLDDARKNLKPLYEQISCGICRGEGRLIFRKAEDFAILPEDLIHAAQKVIPEEKLTVCGFVIGAKAALPEDFYSKKQQKITREGVFTVCRFPGNHEWKDAEETRFWFLGDLLMRVDVIVSAENSAYIEATRRNLNEKYAGLQHASLQLEIIGDCRAEFQFLEKYPRSPRNAAASELENAAEKITLAAKFDPFGIYYPLQFAKADDFLMISILHKAFGDCARWIRHREKGMDITGVRHRSSGK